MELSDQRIIKATKQAVWNGLNDPDVLRACIPGCEELTKVDDENFTALVTLKVGPVKAKMTGDVTLSDIDAPNGYTIEGKGKGNAGFASGGAKIVLEDVDGGTLLKYNVSAKVGGRLAEVGGRFIESTATKMAGQFFDAFDQEVSGEAKPSAAMTKSQPAGSVLPKSIVFAVLGLAVVAIAYVLLK